MRTRLQMMAIISLALILSSSLMAQSFQLAKLGKTNDQKEEFYPSKGKVNQKYDQARSDQFGLDDFSANNGTKSIDAAWDLLYEWDGADGSQVAVETDGQYTYSATYNSNTIWKYEMDGSFVETFSIAGVSNLQDMAYDGQYFYAGDGSSLNIYEMDFTNKTLISTITVPSGEGITGIQHIAYDSQQDAFWCGNTDEMTCVSREGDLIAPVVGMMDLVNGVQGYIHGSAYDPYTEGGPYLWLHGLAASPEFNGIQLVQFDPIAGEFTGVAQPYFMELGLTGFAGGLCVYEDFDNNKAVLLGNNTQDPCHMFAYELAYLPNSETPNSPINSSATAAALGVLECIIEWTNPEETTLGNPLTDLDFVYVYRNDLSDPIHTIGNPTIGGIETFVDNNITVEGEYTYTIYGTNDAGDGLTAVVSAWVGPDAPAIPENVIVEAIGNGDEASITWLEPTSGMHEGYLENITGYKIVRQPGDVTVETSWSGNQPYIDNTLTTIDYYHYEISAINDIGEGPTAISNSVILHYEGTPYSHEAYGKIEGNQDSFEAIDVLSGEHTNILDLPMDYFTAAGTFINGILYVTTEFGEVSIYLEDGSQIIIGEIERPYHFYPSSLAYDEENDVVYLMMMEEYVDAHLYTFNLETLEYTEIGVPGGQIIAMDFASDGFLYGPELINDNLVKIDPATGVSTVVGPIGIDFEWGQDVSYDPVTEKLYSLTVGIGLDAPMYYGYYNLEDGHFTAIRTVGNQFGFFAINEVILDAVDVAIKSVNEPGLMVQNDVFTPLVSVNNFGTQTSSFELTVIINDGDSDVYEESLAVSNLEFQEIDDLVFPQWTADATGAYNITVNASDPGGDANLDNNTKELDFGVFSGCEHTITLNDSNGDGWEDNTCLVSVDGVTVYPALTLEDGLTASFPIYAEDGAAIFFIFNAEGGSPQECSWEMTDGLSNTILSGTGPDYVLQEAFGNCGVGVSDELAQNTKIYPVPATEHLYIETEGAINIQVVNLNGSIVFEMESPKDKTIIDVLDFTKGIYLLRIISAKGIMTKKVIIE